MTLESKPLEVVRFSGEMCDQSGMLMARSTLLPPPLLAVVLFWLLFFCCLLTM